MQFALQSRLIAQITAKRASTYVTMEVFLLPFRTGLPSFQLCLIGGEERIIFYLTVMTIVHPPKYRVKAQYPQNTRFPILRCVYYEYSYAMYSQKVIHTLLYPNV